MKAFLLTKIHRIFSVGGKAMNCYRVYRTTPLHNSYDHNNKKNEKYLMIHSFMEYYRQFER